MNFRFTDKQRHIVEMVTEFVDEEVVLNADEIDESDELSRELVGGLADLSL